MSSDAEPAGTWFMQTLSFGLDAAIALGSMETRKGSGTHGTRLFGALGLDVFAHNRDPFPYTATLWEWEGSEPVELTGEEVVFAVPGWPHLRRRLPHLPSSVPYRRPARPVPLPARPKRPAHSCPLRTGPSGPACRVTCA